jgi:hypothetical protein
MDIAPRGDVVIENGESKALLMCFLEGLTISRTWRLLGHTHIAAPVEATIIMSGQNTGYNG